MKEVLVRGFQVIENMQETLYAVTEKGAVYTRPTTPYRSNCFQSRNWTKCEQLPKDAEYIGHYNIWL